MPGFATALARNICDAGSTKLSPELTDLAYLHVADTLIAAMGGARRSGIDLAARALGYCGDPSGLPPATRALGLALAAHALQADDGDREAGTHPGCVIVPAVWAVKAPDPGNDDVAMAVALGYRVAAVVAGAMPPGRMKGGWHRTPVSCIFGAAAGAAWLLGRRTEDGLRNVLCITASLAAGILPGYQPPGDMEALHPALAAEAGVRAALLAQAGVIANDQALDGERGYLAALSTSALPASIDPGKGLPTSYLKRYACVRAAHEAIDALLHNASGINRIDLSLSDSNMRFSGDFPRSRAEATLNIAYCIAVLLEKAGVPPDPGDFDEPMRNRIRESRAFERITVSAAGGRNSGMTIQQGAGSRRIDLDAGAGPTWAALIRKWDGVLAYGDSPLIGLWDLPDATNPVEALAFLEDRMHTKIGSGLIGPNSGERKPCA